MRAYPLSSSIVLLVACVACGEARSGAESTTGGTAGVGATGGKQGANEGGSANAGAPEGGGANACTTGTLPRDTVSIALNFPGEGGSNVAPSIVSGSVLVERVEANSLDLVDEAGQRMTLRAGGGPWLSFEGLSLGTRFWLSAYSLREHHEFTEHRSMNFSLRTAQDGPVLLASLQGMKETDDGLLGVPLTFSSLCSSSASSGRTSSTGAACTFNTELFEATLETDPPVRILPGTRVGATIDGNSYELALWSAGYTDVSDVTCRPADWEPSLSLHLDVVARDWQGLSANQTVDTAALPACRLSTDIKLFTIDTNQLDWDKIETNAEFAISPVSSLGDTISFSSALGPLLVTGVSAEGRTVLERGHWFSRSGGQVVIRESEGGQPLAISLSGTAAELAPFTARSDVLGSSLQVEPRCEWMSNACQVGGKPQAISLYAANATQSLQASAA